MYKWVCIYISRQVCVHLMLYMAPFQSSKAQNLGLFVNKFLNSLKNGQVTAIITTSKVWKPWSVGTGKLWPFYNLSNQFTVQPVFTAVAWVVAPKASTLLFTLFSFALSSQQWTLSADLSYWINWTLFVFAPIKIMFWKFHECADQIVVCLQC